MSDLASFLVGGAASRPDSVSGMRSDLATRLQAMLDAAPPQIQQALRINSGYRSPEVQAGLWQNALAKYGSPEVARKWVAPPGHSQHGAGMAADLKFLDPAAREWAHTNAPQFGLAFPLANEPWHIEAANARGATPAPQTVAAAPATPVADAAPAPTLAAALPPQQAFSPMDRVGGLPARVASLNSEAAGYAGGAPTLGSLFATGVQTLASDLQHQADAREERRQRLMAMLGEA